VFDGALCGAAVAKLGGEVEQALRRDSAFIARVDVVPHERDAQSAAGAVSS